MPFQDHLSSLWTSTGFVGADLTAYAERLVAVETRQGVILVSLLSLLLLGSATLIYALLGIGGSQVYTYAALAALSLHILLSAQATRAISALYLLGTALMVIIGVGLVLLAHQSGSFSGTLFAAVALLFMVVPMVPWGLRGAHAAARLEQTALDFQGGACGLGSRLEPAPTLSIGYTSIGAGSNVELSHAYGEADAALYQAKNAGRGRLVEYLRDSPSAPPVRIPRSAEAQREPADPAFQHSGADS